jgi:hypothetical protein
MTKQTLREMWGQMPLALRNSVRHIIAWPSNSGTGCSGLHQSQDIMFYGDCGNLTVPTVMIHESYDSPTSLKLVIDYNGGIGLMHSIHKTTGTVTQILHRHWQVILACQMVMRTRM